MEKRKHRYGNLTQSTLDAWNSFLAADLELGSSDSQASLLTAGMKADVVVFLLPTVGTWLSSTSTYLNHFSRKSSFIIEILREDANIIFPGATLGNNNSTLY